MIDREHDLPITKQTEVLKISRGSVYYLPRPVSSADLAIMRRLDQLHYLGLTPSAYDSGSTTHCQGISKAGNSFARLLRSAVAMEL
jgi:hypothetical protein